MPNNMSFLPEDYLEKRIQRRTNFICLTLFVLVMGFVAAAFFVTDRERTRVRQLLKEQQERFVHEAKRIEQLEQLHQRKQQMIRKAKVTSALIETVPRSVILAELINNMPTALSLLEFEMDTKVIHTPSTAKTALERANESKNKNKNKNAKEQDALEAIEIKPTEIIFKLVGLAPTDVQVAQFMTSLGASPLFKDVTLIFSEQITVERQEMRRFRVDLKLNQDVDMRSLSPKRVRRGLMHNPMANTVEFEHDVLEQPETVAAPVANPYETP